MNVLKCDLCGTTSDVRPNEKRLDWRGLVVQKGSDWHPKTESCGGNAFSYVDAWPGYSRWFCQSTLTIHVCSEACMFEALAKLHDGSTIVQFEGFGISTASLIRAMTEDAWTNEPTI